MKKKICCVLTLVMTASLLFGCGSDSASKSASASGTPEKQSASGDFASGDITTYPLLQDLNAEDYVTLGDYKGLEVTETPETPSADEIQSRIDSELDMLKERKSVNRAVKEGDIVNIDYTGKKDGVAFDGGTGTYDLTIGSGSFIPGFEDGLIGAKAGQTLDLNLTFPENYQKTELAGQDVVFTVTVNSVSEDVVPKLTDEIAQTLNPECKSVAEYKEAVTQALQDEKDEIALTTAKNALLEQAIDNAEMKKDAPDWLLDIRIQDMKQYVESYAQSYGVSYEEFIQNGIGTTVEDYEKQAAESAKEAAKQSLVIYAIAQKEGIALTEDDLKEEMSAYLTAYNVGEYDDFKTTLEGRSYAEYLQMEAVEDFLYNNAKVTKQ